ncbi:hypothetical protein [Larkinella punicea]|uniref:Lipocalin-like domain-containing protein n=1 Tax=Larkinella punicea TaxID=2315727 RepID=A0A368JME9_9BACT|nr:hypothetical protein [Larkinella punicea]RCR67321.1 hypothetical protein DUE52_22590 [Larkinella punicea]
MNAKITTIAKLVGCLVLVLVGCRKEEDYRQPNPVDLLGSWTTSGLTFESGGLAPTNAQLADFKNLEANTYTFNFDSTYVKRSRDSVVSNNLVVVRLERGTYKLSNDTLVLTTSDTPTQTIQNTYYHCYFKTGNESPLSLQTLIIRTTKELLLKSLDEQIQTDPAVQKKRAFLNARDMFKITQTLYR